MSEQSSVELTQSERLLQRISEKNDAYSVILERLEVVSRRINHTTYDFPTEKNLDNSGQAEKTSSSFYEKMSEQIIRQEVLNGRLETLVRGLEQFI